MDKSDIVSKITPSHRRVDLTGGAQKFEGIAEAV
jgi:hypothetical protein